MDQIIIEENKDKIIKNTEEDEEAEIDNSFIPVYHSFPVKDEDSQVVSAQDYRSILASKDGDFLLSSTGAQVHIIIYSLRFILYGKFRITS